MENIEVIALYLKATRWGFIDWCKAQGHTESDAQEVLAWAKTEAKKAEEATRQRQNINWSDHEI